MRKLRIAVVDYGMGNLRSISKAFEAIGANVRVSSSVKFFNWADGVVLPGVGAFGEAMTRLKRLKLVGPLRSWVMTARPFLGVCLGFQLLFEESSEFGRHAGLGCFSGKVKAFPRRLRVPHIGWNSLEVSGKPWLFDGLGRNPYVYFVHSFCATPRDSGLVAATTKYGAGFVSAIEQGPVAGVQFHPEKSQNVGIRIIRNFLAKVRRPG